MERLQTYISYLRKYIYKKNESIKFLIIGILLVLFFSNVSWLHSLELSSINFRFSMRGERENKDPIVIIGIDDTSIEELGNFPWKREIYVELVNKLGDYPKVIAFDIYFDVKTTPKDDKEFAELLKQKTNIILSSFYISFNDPRYGSIKRLFVPLDIFTQNSSVGLVNPIYDNDGFIRRFSLETKIFDKEWVSLPLLAVAQYLSISPGAYLEKTKIPKDNQNNVFINYRGGAYKYPIYSFVDVLKGDIDVNLFKDKIVLIGAISEALHDTHFTPFYGYVRNRATIKLGKMPGVEIHANSIGTLLSQDFIIPINEGFPLILLSFVISLVPPIILRDLKGIPKFLLIILIIILYLGLGILLFAKFNIIIPYVIPIVILITSYIIHLLYEFVKEEREKRVIKNLFQRFVSPQVVDIILQSPGYNVLELKRQYISVMFADIRNFTYYSDIMSPEEIIKILNEFFNSAIEIIFKYNGTVDKFLGDSVMALFGAPLISDNTPENAVNTALEIQEVIKSLHKKWQTENYPLFEVGIGIASGEALVGAVGPKQKVEYTAIGSTVNLSSRLEGLAKGGEILICENTYEKIKNEFIAEDLGLFSIKGKEKAVKVYKVLGRI
ncbi:MAG TPA: adenylate/guanylate cyclase domain-containing protein [Dictyoglomaceae bacterium]|nr:adenylate/guanylate cyclase domain-containing protein [Dictyoglomaceae bacterium]HOL39816.1 adenylate/guanylate cyclase domain-containing protein [Dictyoglomaceae bacterium]HPP16231.1 adenylate/guanylate cyclase domain-containing protein [Dictyoglomaceae bacterium]